jgi:hypothetical protein
LASRVDVTFNMKQSYEAVLDFKDATAEAMSVSLSLEVAISARVAMILHIHPYVRIRLQQEHAQCSCRKSLDIVASIAWLVLWIDALSSRSDNISPVSVN